MSGSGATLFGVFTDPAAAEDAGRRLDASGPVWSRVAAIRESR
jgi:4-diphosphocytidyl-2C-methyl-D-erythritol kinase